MRLPINEGIDLIIYALKEKESEKLYQRWVVSGAHEKISFDDFKNSFKKPKEKPTEEILEDVGKILSAWR